MKKICKGLSVPYFKLHSKTIRFMKVTLLLTLFTTLNVSAVVYSQNTKMDLSVNDKSLLDVIRMIEQQSNYRFFFSDNYQDLSNLVSLKAKGENINNILSDLFKDKAITYKVLENDIIVITPTASLKQQLTVSGTVTDASTGSVLPGVNIVIEGTTTGVTTDLDGKYTITVPDQNAVLSFSYVGYLTENITVGSQTTIDVKLDSRYCPASAGCGDRIRYPTKRSCNRFGCFSGWRCGTRSAINRCHAGLAGTRGRGRYVSNINKTGSQYANPYSRYTFINSQ